MKCNLESVFLFRTIKKLKAFCRYRSIWWFFCLLPAVLLFVFNMVFHSLFSSSVLDRGFIEDFPAIWTLVLGLLFLPGLFVYYLPIVSILYEKFSKHWSNFSKCAVTCSISFIAILSSFYINNIWISSQLSDGTITWFSFRGFFDVGAVDIISRHSLENFNLGGIFYAIVCLYFWYLMVVIALLLLVSFICLFLLSFNYKFVSEKSRFAANMFGFSDQNVHRYMVLSTSYIFLLISYYLMIQFNEISIDGPSAFSLHPMRFLFLAIVLVLFVIYLYMVSLIMSFSKTNWLANSDIYCKSNNKNNLVIDTHLLFLFGFSFMMIFYAIVIRFLFASASYDTKLAISFCLFLFFVIISSLFLLSNWKKTSLMADFYDENRFLAHYSNTVDDMYLDIKQYRHDFKNILLGMKEFVDNGDVDCIRRYYYDDVLKNSPLKSKLYSQVDALSRIPMPELKGLLLSKLSYADSLNVSVDFEIIDFFDDLSIPKSEICRLVGILMDNAIEASANSTERSVVFSVGEDRNRTSYALSQTRDYRSIMEITVSNSIDKIDSRSINHMFKPGFSTKGENRGLGLSYVRRAAQKYPSMCFITDTDGKCLSQSIRLKV